MQFQNEKNGYKKTEVEEYVASLNKELAQWKNRCLKAESEYFKLQSKQDEIKKNGENIAIALTAAIEKAKQIENSSKNVYKLKIQQISLLYNRWEMLLNEMISKHPNLEDSHNIKTMLDDFKKAIENVLRQDYDIEQNNTNDPMRALLSKMANYSKSTDTKKVRKIERNLVAKDIHSGQTELNRLEEKSSLIKPITTLELTKDDEYETLADKFLTEEFEGDSNLYSNFLTKKGEVEDDYPYPNDSGFDLKEAVNPKDDLSEIMKSFDFYNDEN